MKEKTHFAGESSYYVKKRGEGRSNGERNAAHHSTHQGVLINARIAEGEDKESLGALKKMLPEVQKLWTS